MTREEMKAAIMDEVDAALGLDDLTTVERIASRISRGLSADIERKVFDMVGAALDEADDLSVAMAFDCAARRAEIRRMQKAKGKTV